MLESIDNQWIEEPSDGFRRRVGKRGEEHSERRECRENRHCQFAALIPTGTR